MIEYFHDGLFEPFIRRRADGLAEFIWLGHHSVEFFILIGSLLELEDFSFIEYFDLSILIDVDQSVLTFDCLPLFSPIDCILTARLYSSLLLHFLHLLHVSFAAAQVINHSQMSISFGVIQRFIFVLIC